VLAVDTAARPHSGAAAPRESWISGPRSIADRATPVARLHLPLALSLRLTEGDPATCYVR